MDDAIDSTLAILLKDAPHGRLVRQIDSMSVDLSRIFLLLCRVLGQRFACDLLQLLDGPGIGVMVVVDGDDFVASCFLKAEDNMGTCYMNEGMVYP